MNNIIDIDTYTPFKDDKFLFDANIWLYLYYPTGNYKNDIKAKYDNFFKKAIQSKSSIFISALILSEIFNRWVRLDFNILKEESPSEYSDFKKDFRKTQKYKESVTEVKAMVMYRIMQIAQRIDDKFGNISLYELFIEIEKSDFNDNYYLVMANSEGFKIVTNDSDFALSRKIPILTANKEMLKRNQ